MTAGAMMNAVLIRESPSGFDVSAKGICWFCGRTDWEASAFAKSTARACIVCLDCIVICLETTCLLDREEERQAMATELRRLDSPHRELTREFMMAMELKDVDDVVSVVQQMGGAVEPATVRGWLRGQSGPSRSEYFERYQRPSPGRCSFCDAVGTRAGRLVKVPAASICERCVDSAGTALVGAFSVPQV